ncbi:MAG TPA: hypothetical protein VN255_06450, partial [Mycobacterium sp.]|nr:hypothetical protein [Mycobacterium sp.]
RTDGRNFLSSGHFLKEWDRDRNFAIDANIVKKAGLRRGKEARTVSDELLVAADGAVGRDRCCGAEV